MFLDLIRLLKSYLTESPEDLTVFSGYDLRQWERLFDLSCRHNVMALTLDALEKNNIPIPKKLHIKWILLRDKAETKYKIQYETLNEIAAMCGSYGCETMVLKGLGLSRYYPIPEHRICGDIDIFLFENSVSANDLFSKHFGAVLKIDYHHHTTFIHNGILIENHHDFVNTTSRRSARRYEKTLKARMDMDRNTLQSITLHDCKVLLPSANFNMLFLTRHMGNNFAGRGFSLRHLLDLMMFIRRESVNIDFVELDEVFSSYKFDKFVNSLKGILIEYFDMPVNTFPPFERDFDSEKRVLEDIGRSGEFELQRAVAGSRIERFLLYLKYTISIRWKPRFIHNESIFAYILHWGYVKLRILTSAKDR